MEFLIREWLDLLSNDQLVIISLSFGLNTNGVTLRDTEIAKKLRLSRSAIGTLKRNAFRVLNYPSFTPLKEFFLNDTTP